MGLLMRNIIFASVDNFLWTSLIPRRKQREVFLEAWRFLFAAGSHGSVLAAASMKGVEMVHRGSTLSRGKGGLRYAAALAAIVFVQIPNLAFAGGSGLKWESATDVVVSSITGPIAYAAAVLALVGVAIAIIAGHGGMLMKAAGAVLGVSVLLFAPDFISTVWGGAAGAGLSGW